MGPTVCPETPLRYCHYTLRNSSCSFFVCVQLTKLDNHRNVSVYTSLAICFIMKDILLDCQQNQLSTPAERWDFLTFMSSPWPVQLCYVHSRIICGGADTLVYHRNSTACLLPYHWYWFTGISKQPQTWRPVWTEWSCAFRFNTVFRAVWDLVGCSLTATGKGNGTDKDVNNFRVTLVVSFRASKLHEGPISRKLKSFIKVLLC
jgi:hypothetical protein